MNETTTLPSTRRLNLHYIAMQMLFWAMYSAACAYQTALLLERGFTNGQVGILIAVRSVSGVVVLPLIGGFADRHPKIPVRLLFTLSLGISLLAGFALMLPMGMIGTAAVLAAMGAFEMSAYPLMDSMALQFINAGIPVRYSIGRGAGSLAYAVTCILLGVQVGRWGVESTLITHVILVALVMVIVALFPVSQHSAVQRNLPAPQSPIALLRSSPSFTIMLLAIFFGLTALMPTTNFMINIINSYGGTAEHLGIAMFVMAASELPVAILFITMHRRWGSGRLLLISMSFIVLKIIALLLFGGVGAVIAIQALQSMGYGLFISSSVFFVNETVPEADRVLGQTILMVASNGLGGAAGGMIGGAVLDWGGIPAMLITSLAIALLGAALAALSLRLRARERAVGVL